MSRLFVFLFAFLFIVPVTFAQDTDVTLTGNSAILYFIVSTIGIVLVAFIVGRQTGTVAGKLTDAVTTLINDKPRTTALENQFNRLPDTLQSRVRQLINVADPVTAFVPGDLDDDVVDWLREITDDVPVVGKAQDHA